MTSHRFGFRLTKKHTQYFLRKKLFENDFLFLKIYHTFSLVLVEVFNFISLSTVALSLPQCTQW
jgi:hypothetical protein